MNTSSRFVIEATAVLIIQQSEQSSNAKAAENMVIQGQHFTQHQTKDFVGRIPISSGHKEMSGQERKLCHLY